MASKDGGERSDVTPLRDRETMRRSQSTRMYCNFDIMQVAALAQTFVLALSLAIEPLNVISLESQRAAVF